jgi:hypothetical protein
MIPAGNEKTEAPTQAGAEEKDKVQAEATAATLPAIGKRPAFRDIKRELTDEDLAGSGAQKLILDMLLTAENDRDDYKQYLTKYYESYTRTKVLEEKLKNDETNEIMFGVGVGVGGTIIGLAPTFWINAPAGILALLVGCLLAGGATVGRLRFKRQTKSDNLISR